MVGKRLKGKLVLCRLATIGGSARLMFGRIVSVAAGVVLLEVVLAHIADAHIEAPSELVFDGEVVLLGVGRNKRMLRID